MTNDSTTKGFLTPVDVVPPMEDDALDAALQATIVGIVGLPGTLVRPRWQETAPITPPAGTDWCALGVVDEDAPIPVEMHNGAGTGTDTLIAYEQLTILASFYGPHARGNAKQLRDGLHIWQNRDTMRSQYGLQFHSAGRVTNVPELTESGKLWVHRADLQFIIVRAVTRTYNVRNLVSIDGSVETDEGAGINFSVPDQTAKYPQ